MNRTNLAILALLAMPGCGAETRVEEPKADLRAEAEGLAQGLIIIDTHVDAPYRQSESEADISLAAPDRDFDYPRAKAGGLNAPFMSIYIPASYQTSGGAKELADELIDWVEGVAASSPEKFAIAYSASDVPAHFAQGKISLPMGMENGAPVEGDLDNLRHFHERGIRYITLTHSKANEICDSSYDDERTWQGLSPFGREVVAEMNRLGIMVDVSHVSDDTFYQVMELSRAPAIASHSSCRKFTPGWERNMDDDMIRLLAEKGGVIQINFGSAFLNEAEYKRGTTFWKTRAEYAAANGLDENSEEMKAWKEAYEKEHPRIYADLSEVVAHIDHVVQLVGVDHVGLGSDFDGVGDSLPTGLKDVSQYPNLIHALLERGYSKGDILKICGGNLLRVWQEVERVARETQASA